MCVGGLFTSSELSVGLCMYRAHVQVRWKVAAARLRAKHVPSLTARWLKFRAEFMPIDGGLPSQSECRPY